jgi:hypothetical protein
MKEVPNKSKTEAASKKPTQFFASSKNPNSIIRVITEAERLLARHGNYIDLAREIERKAKGRGFRAAIHVIREYVDLVDVDNCY